MLKSWQEVLEYAFSILNEVYYNNELPPIVITLQSSVRTNGHFTVGKVWRVEESHFNEINISVEHLDRKPSAKLSTATALTTAFWKGPKPQPATSAVMS